MKKLGLKNKFLIVIFVCVLFLTACSVQTFGVQTMWDKASIKLEENAASTGYSWVCIIENKNMVELISEEVRPASTPGTPGGHQFDFKCNEEGTSNVVFELRRPWEENEAPADKKVYDFSMEGNRLKVTEIQQ